MLSVLVFDPGDHTGWVFRDRTGGLQGGTLYSNKDIWEDMTQLHTMFSKFEPDIVVYETFHLYPGAAKHLAHNEFYTVQLIGAIQMLCFDWVPKNRIVRQAPSIKKYSGGLDERWSSLIKSGAVTEHTKDAYLHLKYFDMVNAKKIV